MIVYVNLNKRYCKKKTNEKWLVVTEKSIVTKNTESSGSRCTFFFILFILFYLM